MFERWGALLAKGADRIAVWERRWPPFEPDGSVIVPDAMMTAILDELAEQLRDNYPFFHPVYAGQMLKPPHPIAAAAYAMAQRINPNAHALDGGPATAKLELEVIRSLATMIGFDPQRSLGHLTSSGTIANLEALWVARGLHPDKGIACSVAAHYTHQRMSQVLRMESFAVPCHQSGRIDPDALEAELKQGRVGTIVATAGTTSIGAVDDIVAVLGLAERYGVRVHVDAAYGGFFRLLADESDDALHPDTSAALRAMAAVDSVVIDPHKHGLQPYGCGSVLFRDATVGRFYKHDSPYTYFTSDDLHLGEISLECSRAGAAAAALWATLRAFPLTAGGLGSIVRRTRCAATELAGLLGSTEGIRVLVDPELDIVSFYIVPASGDARTSVISALTQHAFAELMSDPVNPLYLATLRIESWQAPNHDLLWDSDHLLVFRTVLMKPEHADRVDAMHERIAGIRNT